MKNILILILFLFHAAFSALADDIKLSFGDKGLVVDAGAVGTFSLPPPSLRASDDTSKQEMPVFEFSGNSGTAKYPCGAVVNLEINGNEVSVQFDRIPLEWRHLKFGMKIPISFKDGGKYAIGDSELKDFPSNSGETIIEKGSTNGVLRLVDAMGEGFIIEPRTSYYQLQDNRAFKSNSFEYQFHYDIQSYPDKKSFLINFRPFSLSN